MQRFQEVYHVLNHYSSMSTCYIPKKEMSQEKNMVLANGGAHHNLMNPSEALPDCLMDLLVLLTYFYQKCLKKNIILLVLVVS